MKLIDDKSINRAIQTFRLLPFNSNFYEDVQLKGLKAESVFQEGARYQVADMKWFKSASAIETAFS